MYYDVSVLKNPAYIGIMTVIFNRGQASPGGRTPIFKGARDLMCFTTHSLLILRLTFSCLLYGCQCLNTVSDIIVSNCSLPLYGYPG